MPQNVYKNRNEFGFAQTITDNQQENVVSEKYNIYQQKTINERIEKELHTVPTKGQES